MVRCYGRFEKQAMKIPEFKKQVEEAQAAENNKH